MRKLITTAALAAALATPAFAPSAYAQASDTLKEVTTKGIVMTAGGMNIDVAYKPDGSFTAMDGQVTGKWRIDGDKLCTSSNFAPTESCTAYPKGKKSGDTFEVTGKDGSATIKIK